MESEEKRYIDNLKQVLERAKNYSALSAIEKLEEENEELKNKNFVVTQSYNNALAENRGLKNIITKLEEEKKQLQTRFRIVPEHYLTEALDKYNELERKNAELNEIIHELHKPPLYDGYSLRLKNEELKAQIEKIKSNTEDLIKVQSLCIEDDYNAGLLNGLITTYNSIFEERFLCCKWNEHKNRWELADE